MDTITMIKRKPIDAKMVIKPGSGLEKIANSLKGSNLSPRYYFDEDKYDSNEVIMEIFLNSTEPVPQYVLVFDENGHPLMKQKKPERIIENLQNLAHSKLLYTEATDNFRFEKAESNFPSTPSEGTVTVTYITQPDKFIAPGSVLAQIRHSTKEADLPTEFSHIRDGYGNETIRMEVLLNQKAPVSQYTLVFNQKHESLMKQKSVDHIVDLLKRLGATRKTFEDATEAFRYEKPPYRRKNP